MTNLFKQLDAVLRGDATRMSALRAGQIDIRIGQVTLAVIASAAFAGLCMGSYAVVRGGTDGLLQMFASAVKLPLLFVLTLVVTFPSLYVFNALVGSRLTWESVLRLLVAANGVMLAVFASLGPIIVFFGLSTTSYPFMKTLNVLAAGIGGMLGLAFLLRTLHRLILMQELADQQAKHSAKTDAPDEPSPQPDTTDEDAASSETFGHESPDEPALKTAPAEQASGPRVRNYIQTRYQSHDGPGGALDRLETSMPDKARTVFRVWVVVYAIVGAQMGWVLRPFIGAPGLEFTLFRDRESNFFLDLLETLSRLFGG